MNLQILQGDCRVTLPMIGAESVQAIVTSPPYWGLRNYGGPELEFAAGSFVPMAGLPPVEYPAWRGQLGLEPDPMMFIGHMVEIFREARRVLRPDGTCWVNMGDNHHGSNKGRGDTKTRNKGNEASRGAQMQRAVGSGCGLKAKDVVGQPWRLAFALQADGWYLRQDIIWRKPNPMPESVRDRCTKAHEYIFLLTKSPKYYFDAASIKEKVSGSAHPRGNGVNPKARIVTVRGWGGAGESHNAAELNQAGKRKAFGPNSRVNRDRDPAHAKPSDLRAKQNRSFSAAVHGLVNQRNKRTVWRVGSAPFKDAHFATFPPALILPCILAGSRPGDTILDLFFGSGTTGLVALSNGRKAIGCELNPQYCAMAERRCETTLGLPLS